jgi:Uma2 family endonuclease
MPVLARADYHMETIDGRDVQKPLPKNLHSRAQAHLLRALSGKIPENYEALSELNVICGEDRLIPDVAIVERAARYIDGDLADAALLCVEILSPGQTLSSIFDRAERLLKAGTAAVWVVWPEPPQAWIYTAEGLPEAATTLRAAAAANEIAISVRDIWNSLEDAGQERPT